MYVDYSVSRSYYYYPWGGELAAGKRLWGKEGKVTDNEGCLKRPKPNIQSTLLRSGMDLLGKPCSRLTSPSWLSCQEVLEFWETACMSQHGLPTAFTSGMCYRLLWCPALSVKASKPAPASVATRKPCLLLGSGLNTRETWNKEMSLQLDTACLSLRD